MIFKLPLFHGELICRAGADAMNVCLYFHLFILIVQ